MRDFHNLPRLYVMESLERGDALSLGKSQSHYLARVLRRKIGDQVRLFNGSDGEWLATISQISKQTITLSVDEEIRPYKSSPDIWLLFAPIKHKRNVFIVEKATELGAALIRPVITARTTSKISMDKMQAHIIEAAEQTERVDLPQIRAPQKLADILADWDKNRTLIFADEAKVGEDNGTDENHGRPAAEILAKIKAPAAILIGPEGGFTDAERQTLRAKPCCTPISLGPRILRADTAAAATLALWQAVSGDW
ncbi:MAG: 16S rRNA (uracil(1498)-N(3))-methyltransferase [Robiginitomaculum sp.]|nr:16S rRNA (uracil(1498)-N(3))-methyltransferase [Robiginitomaculum sp.]